MRSRIRSISNSKSLRSDITKKLSSTLAIASRLVNHIALFVSVTSIILIMLWTVGNGLGRFVWGVSLPATTEVVARWLMVPMAAFGWVVAQFRNDQLAVTLLSALVPVRDRLQLRAFALALSCAFMAAISWYGFQSAHASMIRGEYGMDSGWPIWVTRFVIPITGVFFVLLSIAQVKDVVVELSQSDGSRDRAMS